MEKAIWVLVLVTGGVLDDGNAPIHEQPLARFWTKGECKARVEAYNSPDGKAKLEELADGKGWVLTCLEKIVVANP